MTTPSGRIARAVTALLIVLCAGLGTSDGSLPRRQLKRAVGPSLRPPAGLRVERPRIRRRAPLYAPDRVLVRFRPDVDETYADGLLRSYGFPAVRRIPGIGVYSVRTAAGVSVTETLAMLRRNGDIELARPDYRARLADVPNDPYFLNYQYNLRNRGGILDISPDIQPQTTAGADIKATTAWDVTKGGAETIIAIVDTGVDRTHPELVSKLVSSGHDFANNDDDATDDVWHGTHVAGIAAADTNNAEGIAGVAWNCRILPVKVTDATGDGFYSWIIDGIIWAADHGADVINVSLGGNYPDPFLEDACKYAHDKGSVVVAAAGNDGIALVLYPAAYDAYVLAVAASDYNDEIADFSSFGPEVDVAAPGVWILASAPQWYVGDGFLPYLFGSGTSMAAPHVAGLAALIKGVKPDLSVDDIMKLIRYTADDINKTAYPGRDDYAGYGRINMSRALAPYILK
ncbi:MAG: S8 family peptidase [Candidatus Aminicenantales bacterium]